MIPSKKACVASGFIAVSAAFLPSMVVAISFIVLLALIYVDWRASKRPMSVTRVLPTTMSQHTTHELLLLVEGEGVVDIRQMIPWAFVIKDSFKSEKEFRASIVPSTRGVYVFPPVFVRVVGPLGLCNRQWSFESPVEVRVLPNIRLAGQYVESIRRGKWADAARRIGAVGLGTNFDHIRDYSMGDDVRRVNWLATSRLQKPMTNVLRLEDERDVICAIDAGRLMRAPTDDFNNRIDAAVNAATAVAAVADFLGDRVGLVIFDDEVIAEVPANKGNYERIVYALGAAQASTKESRYAYLLNKYQGRKRGLMILFSEIADESVSRSLLASAPLFVRQHALIIASCLDTDLMNAVTTPVNDKASAIESALAMRIYDSQLRAVSLLKGLGARVTQASATKLPQNAIQSYLDVKARAFL